VVPKALEAVSVATLVPAVVGVPLISPLLSMPNPLCRLVPLKVMGSVPVAVTTLLNATPTVPAKVFVGERDNVGATPDGPISNASASAWPEGIIVCVPTVTEVVPYGAPTVPHIGPEPTVVHPPPESVPAKAECTPPVRSITRHETDRMNLLFMTY
jgi:hypothetical protein